MLTALRGEPDTAPQLAAAIRALDCPEGWWGVKCLIETGDAGRVACVCWLLQSFLMGRAL